MITQVGASSSSSFISSSASPIRPRAYDVFLSFRGEDTRNNFTGHFHSYLVQKGIKTFIDDRLPRGEVISDSLLKAIEESRISVIVFSENYASSKWCLEELVKIMQCNESEGQIVYPIFYKVDPSDVRKHRGSFGQALAQHDNLDKVMAWKTALTKAGNLSGCHFSHGQHESEFIQKIVEEISHKLLNFTCLNGDKYLVGIESRLDHVYKLLRVGDSDVQMLGIWGIGGLGKTTIAKAVYRKIARKFEGSCFMENVRERSMRFRGLEKLQEKLLSKTLGLKDLEIDSIDEGSSMIQARLSQKRVLLVLDDVNDLDQLNSLARNSNWFGTGSRIIITTRDKHILHDVNQIYRVEELSHGEAMELFNFNAFKGKGDMGEYIKLINEVVRYAEGLPLVLEVLGSYLHGRSTETWEDAIKYYKRSPKFQHFLKLSYDALEPLMKDVFLHIACFFKGENQNYVMDVLEGCGLPKHGIEVLAEQALISIEENDIRMHDLLEEMGQDIVRQESSDPGERSRLWLYEDVHHVFVNNTGTEKVKGIMVKEGRPDQRIPLNGESFLKLKYLQIFIISEDVFDGDHVNYLSNELRFLEWLDCPLRYFSSNFHLSRKLVLLKMSFPIYIPSSHWRTLKMGFLRTMPWNCISPLGKGLQNLQNLKSIELVNCDGVTNTSDFSILGNLVHLILENCDNVVEVVLSNGFENLTNLQVTVCRNLEKFEVVKEMKSLRRLDLSYTALRKLSSSTIRYLINLEQLILSYCQKLKYMRGSIFELQHLQLLDLSHCQGLVSFPTKSNFSTESTNVQDKHYAPLFVNLSCCFGLREIAEIPRDIYRLDASNCDRLRRISELSNILKGKESKMTPWMKLYGCDNLYSTLARYVAKVKENLPDRCRFTALLFLLFSCRKAAYQVLFCGRYILFKNVYYPASGRIFRIAKWFTCREDFEDHEAPVECNFKIDFPGNFKWEDKGLSFYLYSAWRQYYLGVLAIYINDVRIIEYSQDCDDRMFGLDDHFVWLFYRPFDTIIKRLSQNGLPPPSVCLVKFEVQLLPDPYCEEETDIHVKASCGVHVVMPEDEGPFVNQALIPHSRDDLIPGGDDIHHRDTDLFEH